VTPFSRYFIFLIFLMLARTLPAGAETARDTDYAAAEKYARWIERLVAEGALEEAENALERAMDFADVSSDLCYLTALVKKRLGRPRSLILEAARRALLINNGTGRTADNARFIEAEMLLAMRFYAEAVRVTDSLPAGADTALLSLEALARLNRTSAFHAAFRDAVARYGRDSRFFALLFRRAQALNALPLPGGLFSQGEMFSPRAPAAEAERDLVSEALVLSDALLNAGSDFAPLAAPFISDRAKARRVLEAYRAKNNPSQESIPVCLSFGVIGEETALAALFPHPSTAPARIDKKTLSSVFELLRMENARDTLIKTLNHYSGEITEDGVETRGGSWADGIAESVSVYEEGRLVSFSLDANQDGFAELSVRFGNKAGATLPESAALVCDGESAAVFWEIYPSLARAAVGETVYYPAMRGSYYAPLSLANAFGASELLFAAFDEGVPQLSRRALANSAVRLERPGTEFPDTIERVTMRGGVPVSAEAFRGDQLITKTEYRQGRQVLQYGDLDFDGRLETIRRFRENGDGGTELASSESDWDGDGVYEYNETY
jgi:hypothetical protein